MGRGALTEIFRATDRTLGFAKWLSWLADKELIILALETEIQHLLHSYEELKNHSLLIEAYT